MYFTVCIHIYIHMCIHIYIYIRTCSQRQECKENNNNKNNNNNNKHNVWLQVTFQNSSWDCLLFKYFLFKKRNVTKRGKKKVSDAQNIQQFRIRQRGSMATRVSVAPEKLKLFLHRQEKTVVPDQETNRRTHTDRDNQTQRERKKKQNTDWDSHP